MHHTVEAGYRSGNREGCLRGTRRDVLLQLEHWLEDEQGQRMFWLNGLAGTGKSTIAQTFAEMAHLQRGNLVQVSSAHEILRTEAISKQSSQHLHSNLHISTPSSESSYSKF
jgi:ABC-type transport system involved in cytochrome bd biosynthesis fused ATPase/permease subunit